MISCFSFLIAVHLFAFRCAGSLLLHWFFSSCGEQGLLLVAVRGCLIAVPSLVAEHGLEACRLQQLQQGTQELQLLGIRAQTQQSW